MEFDLKNRLKIYIPALFDLIEEDQIDWNPIIKNFDKKYNELKKKLKETAEPVPTKSSLYGIITQAIQGNISAIRIFDFINKLFQELSDSLNINERKLIKRNLFDILVSQDEKYLNYVGELACLNTILKTGDYRLLKVEQKLEEGIKESSHIDFMLLANRTNSKYLVEIVNVHLSKDNTRDNFKIERLLEQKVRNKVLITAKKSVNPFILVPILWGSHEWIKKILEFYETIEFQLENVLIPSCYIPFTDSEGNMIHRFGTIDTIFEQQKGA
ncbi:MAG: hypothetical protein WD555_03715 [Fulvivirga sp.]